MRSYALDEFLSRYSTTEQKVGIGQTTKESRWLYSRGVKTVRGKTEE